MKTIIDEDAGEVIVHDPSGEQRFSLASAEGFAAASRAWVRASWDAKYVYSFTWFGRPLIQLPDDVLRIQELIWELKPDVIVETGVAHGGSLVFYASLFKAMECGRVIGVDIEIRPHNRKAIEAHPLSPLITLIEGNSVAPEVLTKVKSQIKLGEKVLVILDSLHTKDHVLKELAAYGPLVSVGSYIIATDGVMEQVSGSPRSALDWSWNNPNRAALEFASTNRDFVMEEPVWPFNEGVAKDRVTYWPNAYLRRTS
jgi:cephalosporin hydroxylase